MTTRRLPPILHQRAILALLLPPVKVRYPCKDREHFCSLLTLEYWMLCFRPVIDFVVIPPHNGQDSKVEFYASGFWFSIHFSDFLKCARVEVRSPVRSPAKPDRPDKERALAPFLHGINCVGSDPKIFSL